MLLRLAKVAAPALASIESADVNKVSVGKVAGLIIENLKPEDFRSIRTELAGMTQVLLQDGRGEVRLLETLSHQFAGDMPSMFEWLKFSLEVNFGNFFTVLRALKGKPPAPASASPAPTT